MARLRADATGTGAVCGPVAEPSGALRSAGGSARADGTLEAAGGLDAAAPSAERAVAELCLRMAAAGHRTIHDPAAFARRVLPAQGPAWFGSCDPALLSARPPESGPRVLFVEDSIPLRAQGSGFVRANDILRAMAGFGARVSVFPVLGNGFDPAEIAAGIPDSAEALHDRSLGQLEDFLAERADGFDAIWIARSHNMAKAAPALRRALGRWAARPRLILDAEAVTSVRVAAKHALDGEAFDLDAAVAEEFADAGMCDAIVALSEAEAALLARAGYPGAAILGHARPADPTPRAFDARAGMLFVGAIHDKDSPNLDGLRWFADEVLPLIDKVLGWRTRLTVAGYVAPDVDIARLAEHPRISWRGPTQDLRPLYDQHRVFVAPTRFAAGLPYKLHEAAFFGLPIVATPILAEQVGWTDGAELLAAPNLDPAETADRALALLGDEALWTRVRDAALARIAAEHDPADFAQGVARALGARPA